MVWIIQPEKRPLVPGLVAAAVALWLRLRWPPQPARDAVWAVLIGVAAFCLAIFERRMSHRGCPLRLVRWVAVALGLVAVIQLVWLAVRAA